MSVFIICHSTWTLIVEFTSTVIFQERCQTIWSVWNLTLHLNILANNHFASEFWIRRQNQHIFISVSYDNPMYTFIYIMYKLAMFQWVSWPLKTLYTYSWHMCQSWQSTHKFASSPLHHNQLGQVLSYTSDILNNFKCLDTNKMSAS